MELHPSLQALTRAAYGLESSSEHVEFCVECLETLRRLRGERDQLSRKPSLPGRQNGVTAFFARLLPNRG